MEYNVRNIFLEQSYTNQETFALTAFHNLSHLFTAFLKYNFFRYFEKKKLEKTC